MSVQFGRWNFDGIPIEENYVTRAVALLAPYAPEGTNIYRTKTACLAYGAFRTTEESRSESQPHRFLSHAAMTWDGRLDNQAELSGQLRSMLPKEPTDVEIAATAYERWGIDSFAKLTGDWALAIWDSQDRSLILAKDVVGTRPLYYFFDRDQISWSTLLDPLVLLADRCLDLEQEYVAGWIASSPAAHLTPYVGIYSAPACSLVELRPPRPLAVRKYWDFDRKQVHYATDREYEEHFRIVFSESVKRRLRSDRPVLAELSGGMDSSSVVCMADAILAAGAAPTPRLDTVSYYNESEPNWNERPYFEKVEGQRGQRGCHIAVDSTSATRVSYDEDHFAATPANTRSQAQSSQQFAACMASNGNRILLSGIAGDEVLGGVPNAMPELADYLLRGRLEIFARQSVDWALALREPLLHLAANLLAAFVLTSSQGKPPGWLCPQFVHRYRLPLRGYDQRLRVFGPLPSFQTNLITLDALRRRIAVTPLVSTPLHERRYPYLDRDLLQFIFAIPREQLLRPKERRSLMRRALAGIVPDELLRRKRKAFVVRSLMGNLSKEWDNLARDTGDMAIAALGIVNPQILREHLDKARRGQEASIVSLTRTVQLEWWLRHVAPWGVLRIPAPPPGERTPHRRASRVASAMEVTT
jgi:asparagine synthase (glutamine-hydrolysing)